MNIKFRLVAGISSLAISVCFASAAGDSGMLTAASILSEVAKSSVNTKFFSAELYQTNAAVAKSTNANPICLYYQANYPDGRIACRTEVISKTKRGQTISTITLKNSEGMWFLVKGKALKMEFLGSDLAGLNQSLASALSPSKDSVSATVAEVNFEGIPCYRITESIDTTLFDSMAGFLKINPFAKGSSATPNTLFPAKREYYIGTNDFFIYSVQGFSKDNNKISEFTFRNVNKNPVLPDSAFTIPEDVPIIIAHSAKEYIDNLSVLYWGSPARRISKPPNAAARYTVLLIAVGSAFLMAFYHWKDISHKKG